MKTKGKKVFFKSSYTDITFPNDDFYFIIYNNLVFDVKSNVEKYINQIEKIVRNSIEYKNWVKSQLQSQVCVITGISKLETNDIELHHYPYTLYHIIQRLIERFQKMNEKYRDLVIQDHDSEYFFNYIPTFQIAWQAIDLHLLDIIPYVPLLSSYHKLAHENFMEFKQDQIKNYDKIELLNQYLDLKISKKELIQTVKLKYSGD